jgi:hypothetical protein
MAVQCVLVGKGKDDVFTAVYGETTFDKVLKAYNENKIVQVVYQNRVYYLDNTTVISSPEVFNFISIFSNQNDETGEIKHYVISLMTGDSWSGPFLQKSTPATHAKTHAKDGADSLSPADIGAMELSENVLKQSNEDITSQVAEALSGDLVPFSGGTMTGLLNVLTPVGDSNATTKKYVDDALKKKIEMDSIGDLHVWRKTVVTTDPIPEIPASFKLGDVEELQISRRTSSNSDRTDYIKYAEWSSEITINNNGDVSLKNPTAGTDESNFIYGADTNLIGKYFMFPSSVAGMYCSILCPLNIIYYIPADSESKWNGNRWSNGSISYFTKAQKVIGIPYTPEIPAGTTITYPVSTNPNAYQEGDDAKAAGYVVGDVMTGNFRFGNPYSSGTGFSMQASTSVIVDDNGTVNLAAPITSNSINKTGVNTQTEIEQLMLGKYIIAGTYSISHSDDIPGGIIIYIPNDAVISLDTDVGAWRITKYQSITGYAAIPANTTIEYLGKLGDKSKIRVVSYIGTGAYGVGNPCSITVDFRIKALFILEGRYWAYSDNNSVMVVDRLTTEYKDDLGLSYNNSSYSYGKRSSDYKTVYWYNTKTAQSQFNVSGATYYFLVIG